MKACDYKWKFDQDLLQKLRFDEQIIIISHLQNFVIKGKNQNDNQQNQQQNEFVIKYIKRPKDFANLLIIHFSDKNGKLSDDKNIKIKAERINVKQYGWIISLVDGCNTFQKKIMMYVIFLMILL